MSFFNLLLSAPSLFNFSLQDLVPSLSFSPSAQLPISKSLAPEQTIQETNPSPSVGLIKKVETEAMESVNRQSRVELFTQQQQLINQYMHLNIQLLSKKLSNLQQFQKLPKTEEPDHQNDLKSSKKKIKKVNNCGHSEKEHYAKGMCGNCYHKYGRNKKPWNCPHEKLYANGMCQNCYINSYNRKKREEREEERNDEVEQSNLKQQQNS